MGHCSGKSFFLLVVWGLRSPMLDRVPEGGHAMLLEFLESKQQQEGWPGVSSSIVLFSTTSS